MQPNALAHDMLNKIEDPNVRQQYANILNGQIVALVHCNSNYCEGRVIANIMADGTCQETTPLSPTDDHVKKLAKAGKRVPIYTSGLEGDRVRLDGSRGFRCYCGNNSILHAHEKGHIAANAPSKRDVEAVFGKMARNPSDYPEVNGKMDVDGFTIERVLV